MGRNVQIEKLHIDEPNYAEEKHLEAYHEYLNLVGDTDGGTLLNEAEYEELRKKARLAKKNELYVFWSNVAGQIECKAIGPSSSCFCGHRYRDHAWFDVENKQVSCRIRGCKCAMYDYIPIHGSGDLKCTCKHSYEVHDSVQRNCWKCHCVNFATSYRCSCGELYKEHKTVFQTTKERLASSEGVRPHDSQSLVPMGGISNFSSLLLGSAHSGTTNPVYKALEEGTYRR